MPSRRDFTKLAFSALPGTALLSNTSSLLAAGKPNSLVNGVQLGLNVPYSFGSKLMTADQVLQNCVELNLSAVELRTQPVEMAMGADPAWIETPKGLAKDQAKANHDKLREWRKSAPMDKAKEFRAKWESAGVFIQIVKVDGIFKMEDDEVDYAFNLAKALGGRAISTEISHTESELKRLGSFADKHQFFVGYHGHQDTTPEHWELAFKLAKFNGANVDIGHFVAGQNASPVPFITKYHDRVTHVHIKDRKFNRGANTEFGQGDTPIGDVLHLIRDNKWPIQATIEFEYSVPKDSTRMAEIAKALEYCRKQLA